MDYTKLVAPKMTYEFLIDKFYLRSIRDSKNILSSLILKFKFLHFSNNHGCWFVPKS